MESFSRQVQPKRQNGGTHTDTTRPPKHTARHSDDFINKVLQIHRQTDENLRVFQDFEIRLRSLQHLRHSLATINQRYVDMSPTAYAPSPNRPAYMPAHTHTASFGSTQREKRPPTTEHSPHVANPFERPPTKVVLDVPVTVAEKDSSAAVPVAQNNTATATATAASPAADAPPKRKRKSRVGPDVFCSLCGTTESQFWRRNGTNQRYCNACGLRMKTRSLREAHASMRQAFQQQTKTLTALAPAPTAAPTATPAPAPAPKYTSKQILTAADALAAAVGAPRKEVWIDCLEESESEQDAAQQAPAKKPREV